MKTITADLMADIHARLPLPDEGFADGGTPYTPDEMDLMFRQELARELDVTLEELPA